jgi:Rod binding domain-containing protein
MNAISPAPGASPPGIEAKLANKGRHAALEFESVLLQTLLEPLEKSFSTLPGKDDLSGGDNYHYLGTQALASSLAQSGGLGLARMMVRSLLKPHGLSAKVSGSEADKSSR